MHLPLNKIVNYHGAEKEDYQFDGVEVWYKCLYCRRIFKTLQERHEHKQKHEIPETNEYDDFAPFILPIIRNSSTIKSAIKNKRQESQQPKKPRLVRRDSLEKNEDINGEIVIQKSFEPRVYSHRPQATRLESPEKIGESEEIKINAIMMEYNNEYPESVVNKVIPIELIVMDDTQRSNISKPTSEDQLSPRDDFKEKHKRKSSTTVSKRKPNRYPCIHCKAIFSSPKLYKEHIIIHEPTDTNIFICPHCERTSVSLASLRRHIVEMHTVEVACTNCGKGFGYNTSLNQHMKSCRNQTMNKIHEDVVIKVEEEESNIREESNIKEESNIRREESNIKEESNIREESNIKEESNIREESNIKEESNINEGQDNTEEQYITEESNIREEQDIKEGQNIFVVGNNAFDFNLNSSTHETLTFYVDVPVNVDGQTDQNNTNATCASNEQKLIQGNKQEQSKGNVKDDSKNFIQPHPMKAVFSLGTIPLIPVTGMVR